MPQPLCPFCLEPHEFTDTSVCPNVLEGTPPQPVEVPQQYLDEYNLAPPLWLVTVGFRRHGKTCYLAALTVMLEELHRVWEHSTYRALDSFTDLKIKQIQQEAQLGTMPPKTDVSLLPRPMLITTYDVPDIGSKCLVLYDTAGEFYDTLMKKEDADKLRAFKKVQNIWFLVSLSDLDSEENTDRQRINYLLNTYLDSMKRMGQSLRDRNLIVVYTKADRLISDPGYPFSSEIREYLLNDPLQDLTNYDVSLDDTSFKLDSYIDHLKGISVQLENYTRKYVKGGGAFIELAKRSGMNLYFCLTSALGNNPHNGQLNVEASRYRVLDPYLLALYLERENRQKKRNIRLILDASSSSDRIYMENLNQISKELGDLGDITTYYMGQVRAASRPDQSPPHMRPKSTHPRLVGPLLEKNNQPENFFIVLSGEQIRDLDDYIQSDLADRLLLVAFGEEEYQNWPNQITLRSGDSLNVLYPSFRKLIEDYETSKEK